MFPQVQHNLNRCGQGLYNNTSKNFKNNKLGFKGPYLLVHVSSSHLTVAEVLQEVGEALDDAGVFGTVSVGVTDEDFGTRPRPFCVQRCAVIG